MSLLKFKAYNKLRNQVKEQKLKESNSKAFNKAFTENLAKYKAKDPSELDEDQLSEFLETMKQYKKSHQK